MKTFINLLLIIVMVTDVLAGGILKDMSTHSAYLRPSRMSIAVSIHDQVATTTLRETFINTTSSPMFMTYGFPLSINASASEFNWTMYDSTKIAELTASAPDSAAAGPGGGAAPITTGFYFIDGRTGDILHSVPMAYRGQIGERWAAYQIRPTTGSGPTTYQVVLADMQDNWKTYNLNATGLHYFRIYEPPPNGLDGMNENYSGED